MMMGCATFLAIQISTSHAPICLQLLSRLLKEWWCGKTSSIKQHTLTTVVLSSQRAASPAPAHRNSAAAAAGVQIAVPLGAPAPLAGSASW